MTPAVRAKQAVVTVDAHQMPWDPRQNSDRPFGIGDGQSPRYVFGLDLTPGMLVRIYAKGSVTVLPSDVRRRQGTFATADQPTAMETRNGINLPPTVGYTPSLGLRPPLAGSSVAVATNAPAAVSGTWGPEGQAGQYSNGRTGVFGTRFPSFYLGSKHYPVRINQLVGAFVDADGLVVGQPFPVGERVTLRVPQGAAAIALGLNSETFSGNRGTLVAVVSTSVPRVIVGPAGP